MKQRGLGCLLEIAETVVLTLLIFLAIQYFVASPYQIEQQSMERTLEPSQYVLVDKLSPHFSDYKRGDIVVFTPPEGWEENGSATPFIKRVIGVAGDRIELRGGDVYVNGLKLDEPYVYDGQPTDPLSASGDTSWTIPKDDLFVMGDHRVNSMDSRAFGPIAKSSVIGRAFLRYWPLDKVGIVQSATYSNLDAASPGPSPSGSTSPGTWPGTNASDTLSPSVSATPHAAASPSRTAAPSARHSAAPSPTRAP